MWTWYRSLHIIRVESWACTSKLASPKTNTQSSYMLRNMYMNPCTIHYSGWFKEASKILPITSTFRYVQVTWIKSSYTSQFHCYVIINQCKLTHIALYPKPKSMRIKYVRIVTMGSKILMYVHMYQCKDPWGHILGFLSRIQNWNHDTWERKTFTTITKQTNLHTCTRIEWNHLNPLLISSTILVFQ